MELAPDSLDNPVDFRGYVIKGSKAAVSVEETECSNTGVKSK
jgi:gamma-glutamyltranspeptidase/glutathione hydrolase/leukotriene-C4 hydrolase